MITDIEEESKTKFSMGVEFTFLLKASKNYSKKSLQYERSCGIISLVSEMMRV